jgi:integrase/recombinase XerD
MNGINQPQTGMQLYDAEGRRLYFTEDERSAFVAAAAKGPARGPHLLRRAARDRLPHLRSSGPDGAADRPVGRVVVFESLKKRRQGVYRAVPVPPELLARRPRPSAWPAGGAAARVKAHLWPWSRMTAFRRVQEVIAAAGIPDGPHACPKGVRHGFGVQAVSRGIALNMVQKWLGHAQLTTTAIYANAVGEEEQSIAARMW